MHEHLLWTPSLGWEYAPIWLARMEAEEMGFEPTRQRADLPR